MPITAVAVPDCSGNLVITKASELTATIEMLPINGNIDITVKTSDIDNKFTKNSEAEAITDNLNDDLLDQVKEVVDNWLVKAITIK